MVQLTEYFYKILLSVLIPLKMIKNIRIIYDNYNENCTSNASAGVMFWKSLSWSLVTRLWKSNHSFSFIAGVLRDEIYTTTFKTCAKIIFLTSMYYAIFSESKILTEITHFSTGQ